ncbi:MAG: hypothetical protein K6G07_06570 [Lachnospiraceae bacterium]|nr:hypothetical protein [Lachnospiraceae bacterium]
MDNYIEYMVKKPSKKITKLIRVILIACGGFLFMVGIMSIFPITLLGLLFFLAAYFVSLYSYVEYEYLYLDKELTVDKIMNQTKRKNACVYKLEKLVACAPLGHSTLAGYEYLKAADYSSGLSTGNPYKLVFEGENNKKECIIIDTNEELVKSFKMCAPRIVVGYDKA